MNHERPHSGGMLVKATPTITQIYKTFFESRSNLRPAFRIRGLRTSQKWVRPPALRETGERPRHGGMLVAFTDVKYIKLSDSLFGPVSTRVVGGPSAERLPTRRMR